MLALNDADINFVEEFADINNSILIFAGSGCFSIFTCLEKNITTCEPTAVTVHQCTPSLDFEKNLTSKQGLQEINKRVAAVSLEMGGKIIQYDTVRSKMNCTITAVRR